MACLTVPAEIRRLHEPIIVTWVYHTAGHFVTPAPKVLIDAPKAGISKLAASCLALD